MTDRELLLRLRPLIHAAWVCDVQDLKRIKDNVVLNADLFNAIHRLLADESEPEPDNGDPYMQTR
jgi:hypothetical protein